MARAVTAITAPAGARAHLWYVIIQHTCSGDAIMADNDMQRDGLENRVKGAAKEAEGHLRDAAGGLTGDTSEQVKGKAQQVQGKVQRKAGELEQKAGDDQH
jgi:uncharacterized protein YjbJ (UPF0337 family)